jgi:hypothetical protein
VPNAIKYSATTETRSLRSGNFYLGVGDISKGTTAQSGFWNGLPIPDDGYLVYVNKASGGPSIHTARSESELISIINKLAGASYTTIAECFSWAAGQTTTMILNKNFPSIVTDSLGLALDCGFVPSYPETGSTWFDCSTNELDVSGGQFSTVNGDFALLSNTNDAQTASSNLLNTDYHSIQLVLQFKGSATYPNGWTGGWEQFIGYYSQGDDRSPGIWRFPDSRTIHWTYNPGNTYVNFGMDTNQTQFTLNRNFHVCMVKDGGTGTAYVNGIPVLSTSVVNPKVSGDSVFRFFDYYTADLMDIKVCFVYRKALSQAEILQNYYLGPIITSGLTLALDPGTPCCNDTPTTITDLTQNQWVWNYEDTVTRSQDFGGTLRLNSGRIYRDSIAWYGNYTFSFWVKMVGSPTYGNFYTENFRGSGGCARVYSTMNGDGTFSYNIWDNSSIATFGTGSRSVTTTTNVQDGNWHQVTCVWSNGESNRDRGLYVFVNGVQEGYQDMIGNDGAYASMHLGGAAGCVGTNSYNCYLGPALQYSYVALNNAQVLQNYNAHFTRFK